MRFDKAPWGDPGLSPDPWMGGSRGGFQRGPDPGLRPERKPWRQVPAVGPEPRPNQVPPGAIGPTIPPGAIGPSVGPGIPPGAIGPGGPGPGVPPGAMVPANQPPPGVGPEPLPYQALPIFPGPQQAYGFGQVPQQGIGAPLMQLIQQILSGYGGF